MNMFVFNLSAGIISNRAYWIVQVQMKNAAEAEANAANAAPPPTLNTTTADPKLLKSSEAIAIAIPQEKGSGLTNNDQGFTTVTVSEGLTERPKESTNWRSIKTLLRKDKDLKRFGSNHMPNASVSPGFPAPKH
jgi:hypothetical protein